jgi:hypothetical protein
MTTPGSMRFVRLRFQNGALTAMADEAERQLHAVRAGTSRRKNFQRSALTPYQPAAQAAGAGTGFVRWRPGVPAVEPRTTGSVGKTYSERCVP